MASELGGLAVRVAYDNGPSGVLHRRSGHHSGGIGVGRVGTASCQEAVVAMGSGQRGQLSHRATWRGRVDHKSAKIGRWN